MANNKLGNFAGGNNGFQEMIRNLSGGNAANKTANIPQTSTDTDDLSASWHRIIVYVKFPGVEALVCMSLADVVKNKRTTPDMQIERMCIPENGTERELTELETNQVMMHIGLMPNAGGMSIDGIRALLAAQKDDIVGKVAEEVATVVSDPMKTLQERLNSFVEWAETQNIEHGQNQSQILDVANAIKEYVEGISKVLDDTVSNGFTSIEQKIEASQTQIINAFERRLTSMEQKLDEIQAFQVQSSADTQQLLQLVGQIHSALNPNKPTGNP